MFLRQLKSQIQASSIGRSLILVSVITSSVITLLFTSLQIYLDIQREKKYVEKSMHEIQTIYKETLPAAIWDLSVTNIQQHASSISQMKFVSRVRISGDGFNTIEYKSNNFPNIRCSADKIILHSIQAIQYIWIFRYVFFNLIEQISVGTWF